MVWRGGGGWGWLGGWIEGLAVSLDDPWAKQNFSGLDCWCHGHCHSSVVEPAPRGETSYRSTWLSPGHCGADFATIHRGAASLPGACDYCGPLRGVSVSRVRHGGTPSCRITGFGSRSDFFGSLLVCA